MARRTAISVRLPDDVDDFVRAHGGGKLLRHLAQIEFGRFRSDPEGYRTPEQSRLDDLQGWLREHPEIIQGILDQLNGPKAEPEASAEAEAPGEATGVPSPPDPPTDEEPQEAKSDFTVERNAYGPGTNRVLYRGEPLGLWLNAGGRREWDSQTVFNTLVGMGLEPNIASKFAETRASVLAEDAAVVLPPTSQPSGLDAILGRRSA